MRDGGIFPNVNAIGVELEGAWDERPCRCHDIEHDGSVRVPGHDYGGEIPIGPLYSWETAKAEILRHYPHAVNRTCGLHVHLSFPTPGHYSAIMSPRFEKFLHARLMRYGRIKGFSPDGQFFQRLDGRNTYCKTRYSDECAMIQARATYKSGERYAFLNYCHGLHKTAEVRALPAFTRPMSAIKAIYYVVESFEKFLSLPGALVPHVETGTADIPDTADGVADLAASIDAGAWSAMLTAEVR